MDWITNPSEGQLLDLEKGRFWNWCRQGTQVTTSSGKLGKTGRANTEDHGDAGKAESELSKAMRKKYREGFVWRAEENGGYLKRQFALVDRFYFRKLAFDHEQQLIVTIRVDKQILLCDADSGRRVVVIDTPCEARMVLPMAGGEFIIQADARCLYRDIRGYLETLTPDGIFPSIQPAIAHGRLIY